MFVRRLWGRVARKNMIFKGFEKVLLTPAQELCPQRLCPCAAHPTQRTQAQAHGLIPGAKNAKTLRLPPACDPMGYVHDCACTPASRDDPAR